MHVRTCVCLQHGNGTMLFFLWQVVLLAAVRHCKVENNRATFWGHDQFLLFSPALVTSYENGKLCSRKITSLRKDGSQHTEYMCG